MEYLVVALAVWFLWNVWIGLVIVPEWVTYGLFTGISIGGAAWVEPDNWWYGFGLMGLSSAMMLVADLLLVTTDWIRTRVLSRR